MDIKNIVNENDKTIIFSVVDHLDYTKVSPITQSYGFCFTKDGSFMIGKMPNGQWLLPGGTIEKDEHPEQTLHREVDEEVSITLEKVKLIGIQKAEIIDKENTKILYQLRYAAIIKDILPLTVDPDNGQLWERKLITVDEFLHYLDWGTSGLYFAKKAYQQFLEWQNN